MSNWRKLIVLLGVLALSAGCSFDESQYPKPEADNKSPDVVVSAPEPSPEPEVEEEEEVDNSVSIYLGDKKLITLSDNVTSGKVNSLELAKMLHNLLSGNLYTDENNKELLKDFDQSTLNAISNTLAFVIFDAYNFTVGLGLNNNGQTEIITRTRENGINKVLNILFHPKDNKLDLVDMLYMIDYYKYESPSQRDDGRECWDSKTSIIVECGAKHNVIASLSAKEPSNTNVVVNWEVAHDKVTSFELEILDEDGESNIYKVAGSARNFLLLELKSRTHYDICLRALVNGVWSDIVTIRHRTKR